MGICQVPSDPMGGLHCFWCPNKTRTPPLSASGALKHFKNGLETRKLPNPPPPPSRGGQELKKKIRKTLQSQFPNTPRIIFMLLCCYYSSKIIYRIEGGALIGL